MEYMGFRPGEPLLGKKIDYVFLGACTNGRIEDFRAFASLVKGKKKADDVTVWLVPGSWQVEREIVRGDRLRFWPSRLRPSSTGMFRLSGDE